MIVTKVKENLYLITRKNLYKKKKHVNISKVIELRSYRDILVSITLLKILMNA